MRMGIRAVVVVCLFCVCLAKDAKAQIVIQYGGPSRYELGGQFSGLQLNGAVTGGSLGVGAHFGYHFNEYVALDTEVSGYNFGGDHLNTVTGLFGADVGYRWSRFGICAKVRPGFIHFPSSSELIPPVTQHPTHFALDTGVVLVRYFENHMYVRCDVGSMFVNYGGGSYTNSMTGQMTHLGMPGGVLVALGVGAHW